MNLEIDLGFKCNLKCSYCIMSGSEFNTPDINKITSWINSSLNSVEEVRFIGGEPSLHLETIYDFISKTKDKIKSIHVITNGTNIKQLINVFSNIHTDYNVNTSITISIDRLGYDKNRNYNMDYILSDLISMTDEIINNKISIDINRVLTDQTDIDIQNMNSIISNIDFISCINDLKLMDSTGLVDGDNFIVNCNLNCNDSVFIRNDKIYFCKLMQTFHNVGMIRSIDDITLDDLVLKRTYSKPILHCMFDSIGRNKHEKEKRV